MEAKVERRDEKKNQKNEMKWEENDLGFVIIIIIIIGAQELASQTDDIQITHLKFY